MKSAGVLAVTLVFLLLACQPTSLPLVTILENDQITTLQSDERVPAALLNQAGITLNPKDRILLNGLPISPDQPITTYPATLQIRGAISLTITTPEGEKQIQSSAFTIGEALQEASIWLRAGDKVTLPLNFPILVP